LAPDVALQIKEWTMVEPPEGLKLIEPSLELAVHVKRAGTWKVFAARPSIPFRPENQQMPSELPTAAGFSDPSFAEELESVQNDIGVADDCVVISPYGNIYRGRASVQEYLNSLSEGRESLNAVLNSARRVTDDIAIADWSYEATGKWDPPNRDVVEGTVRGMWSAVYRRQNGQWMLQGASAMIPYIPAE
jgi:hypothetical protein